MWEIEAGGDSEKKRGDETEQRKHSGEVLAIYRPPQDEKTGAPLCAVLVNLLIIVKSHHWTTAAASSLLFTPFCADTGLFKCA